VPWAENPAPKVRVYHAEVRYGTYVAGRSDPVSVRALRTLFTVTLAFSDRTVAADGKVRYKATATASPTLTGTPYTLRIRSGNGSVVGSCFTDVCTAPSLGAGTYRATVEDGSAREFGASSSWTLTETEEPREEAVDGIDLVGLAAMLAGDADPCLKLAGFPGASNTSPPSSLNDYQKACETLRLEGKSMLEILRHLAAMTPTITGASVIWWLAFQETADAPTWVPPFPPPPWDPPSGNAGRDAARRALGQSLGATAAALAAFEVARYALDQTQAESIARACLEYTARIGYNSGQQCVDAPIFASGADVPEATNHDIEALATNPWWVRLNYEYGETKPGSGWQTGMCPDIQAGQECDEYPFFATEQGGPLARPLPDLKAIDATQNRSQGGMYNAFRQACGLKTGTLRVGGNSVGGTPFLGTPVPPAVGLPTWYGCRTRLPAS
jgi:hypothetical protein